MSTVIESLATPGKYIAFHIQAISIIATGILILLSAGELGAAAVFLVPIGIYTVFMGICFEVFFGLRFGIAAIVRYFYNRKEKAEEKA
jgi:hypothetical protein